MRGPGSGVRTPRGRARPQPGTIFVLLIRFHRPMSVSHDLEHLIGTLNAVCRTALEEAASLCVSQTHYNVEVEYLLITLLEQGPGTDVHQIFKNFDLEPTAVIQELTEATEAFKRGNSRTPSMPPQIV